MGRAYGPSLWAVIRVPEAGNRSKIKHTGVWVCQFHTFTNPGKVPLIFEHSAVHCRTRTDRLMQGCSTTRSNLWVTISWSLTKVSHLVSPRASWSWSKLMRLLIELDFVRVPCCTNNFGWAALIPQCSERRSSCILGAVCLICNAGLRFLRYVNFQRRQKSFFFLGSSRKMEREWSIFSAQFSKTSSGESFEVFSKGTETWAVLRL